MSISSSSKSVPPFCQQYYFRKYRIKLKILMTFQRRPYTSHTSFVWLIMSQLEDRIFSEFKIVFFTFEDRLLKFSRSVFFPSKDRIVLAKRPSTFSLRTIYFLHFTSYVSIIVSQPEDRISYELKIVYFTLEGRIQFWRLYLNHFGVRSSVRSFWPETLS